MADGVIKIDIEVDGKQVNTASRELDKLEDAGHKSGKGIKSAESSMDSLSDKSAKAGTSVKGASDAIDDLGDSGSKAGKGLKGTEGAVDGVSDSASKAGTNIKGTGDAIDGLGDSGSKAGKDLKGVDGAIDGVSDSSANAASSVKGAGDAIEGMGDKSASASSDLKGASDGIDGVSNESQKASGNVQKFAAAIGLVTIASMAFNTLKSSLDGAISRFDTLNAFPKVLQALGVSAEDAEAAMQKLGDGIDGLPTTLDDIAASAQDMYTSFGDMDEAADTAIALNNALLGSGASAEQAKRGTQQYSKALQTGKVDMMTWNTLSETMGVGLIKIAEEFGYAGKSAKNDLYKALQDGTVTLDQFNAKLIEVGTGTGIMAELAKENSLGIATSLGNLKNAAARGIANILESFNKLSKEVTGKDIAQNIDSLKVAVNSSFKVIGNVIEGATPIVIAFGSAIKEIIPVVQTLSPAIIGLMAAYGSYVVITKVTGAINASNAVLALAVNSSKTLTLATQAQMATQIAATNATKADILATAAHTGVVKLSTIAIGVMTGQITLSTAVKTVATAATYALGAAWRFLLGPVGWIIAGIGLLVAGVITLVKWFNKTTEDAKRLNAETEDLSDSVDNLNDSVDSSSQGYKDNKTQIDSVAIANKDLAHRIEDLSEKENKSAADKQLLANYIDQLNGSIEGLNLTYDEEANALNMSSKELQARLDLMKETEAGMAAQERLAEIIEEQNEAQMKLGEINELREEWNQKLEEGSVKSREHKDAIKELDEQEELLKETLKLLGEQYGITEEQIIAAAENATAAIEEGNLRQITSYEELEDRHKEVFDNMKETYDELVDNATNAFDRMNDESKATADEMIANLEHNQKMTEQWGENVAKLYDWAGKEGHEGFLHWLESMGPESAAELAVVSNMSDSELKKFAKLMDKGAEVAGDSFKTSLGDEFDEAIDVMINFVDDGSKTLREQIKNSGFDDIGSMVPEGLADGIDKGSKNAENASKKMADDTTKAAQNAFQVKSPSRVFKGIGSDVADGLALGISDNTNKVVQAVQKMFRSVQTDSINSFRNITRDYDRSVREIERTLDKLPRVAQKSMKNMLDRLRNGATQQVSLMRNTAISLLIPYNRTPSQFRSIGLNAMAGLNNGLNAGSGRVMATANRIANNVAATMRRALKIHSPSRLMRDEIGKMIPAGIAMGIDFNAKMVDDALGNMVSGMMMSTPEVALGAHQMSYANAINEALTSDRRGQRQNNNTTKQVNSTERNKSATYVFEVDNRELAKIQVDDITQLQERNKVTSDRFKGR